MSLSACMTALGFEAKALESVTAERLLTLKWRNRSVRLSMRPDDDEDFFSQDVWDDDYDPDDISDVDWSRPTKTLDPWALLSDLARDLRRSLPEEPAEYYSEDEWRPIWELSRRNENAGKLLDLVGREVFWALVVHSSAAWGASPLQRLTHPEAEQVRQVARRAIPAHREKLISLEVPSQIVPQHSPYDKLWFLPRVTYPYGSPQIEYSEEVLLPPRVGFEGSRRTHVSMTYAADGELFILTDLEIRPAGKHISVNAVQPGPDVRRWAPETQDLELFSIPNVRESLVRPLEKQMQAEEQQRREQARADRVFDWLNDSNS